ncbi:MAG TPA: metallophosphoesterase [Spirochaetota bacterium]|nr:metallophosphoesterase [Spirochaetota bacterium]HOL56862.1 metallophosphoesterase [Spirochaetota bacterium]HPP03358.1 metallophosphoesterase [Spirochaetota bacterium]
MRLKFKILFLVIFFLSCDYFDPSGFFCTVSIDERFKENQKLPPINPPSLINDKEFSFLLITDTHYYKEQLNYIKDIEAKKDEFKIDFIIINGDIVQSGLKSQYELAKEDFKNSSIPIYTTIGNHDIYNNGYIFYKEYFGKSIYDFKIDTLHLIFLDTANGTLGSLQLKYLEDILKNSNSKNKIVFTHYNLIEEEFGSFTSYSYSDEVYKIFSLFEKYNVNFCISGHIHSFYLTEIRGTTYISLTNMASSSNNHIIFRYKNGLLKYEIF